MFFLLDYVYFENSSSNPYLIRRIEELNKVGCLLLSFDSIMFNEHLTVLLLLSLLLLLFLLLLFTCTPQNILIGR